MTLAHPSLQGRRWGWVLWHCPPDLSPHPNPSPKGRGFGYMLWLAFRVSRLYLNP